MKHRGSVLLSLLALAALVFGQEGGAPGGETVALEAPAFCEGSVAVLRDEIMALWNPTEFDVFINCLAFNERRRLETGIVSAMPRDGTPGTRYVLNCRNNALLAMQSNQSAIQFNLTQQDITVCEKCQDAAATANICVNRKFYASVLCYYTCYSYRVAKTFNVEMKWSSNISYTSYTCRLQFLVHYLINHVRCVCVYVCCAVFAT